MSSDLLARASNEELAEEAIWMVRTGRRYSNPVLRRQYNLAAECIEIVRQLRERGGGVSEWRQARPAWCPHRDCGFRRRAQDAICGGELPEPVDHDGTPNTHRVCFNGAAEDGGVLDLQVNPTDLGWFRWIFDALDGLTTSWLSWRVPHRKDEQHGRIE